MLSYGFSHKFVLTLFYDKKCCNYINLFPCILWDLFIMSLVLSWWRLLKKLISQLGSQVVQLAKVTWEAHAESWRVNEFRDSSCNLANSRDDLRNALIFISCSILHQLNTKSSTIKSHKIQGTKLKKLQHFLSQNKANIKYSCKSQFYNLALLLFRDKTPYNRL